MVMRHNGQTVVDIQSMKARGQKISMLYVTTLDEAAAAGVTMLSIEGRFFSPERFGEGFGDSALEWTPKLRHR
jgi:3-methyl-2-oxobutanoate hydroxymethyltransferase